MFRFYLIFLVPPHQDTMTISDLPDGIESDTEIEISCLVSRVRPELSDMYWLLNGVERINGSHTQLQNSDGMTFSHHLSLSYRQANHKKSRILRMKGSLAFCVGKLELFSRAFTEISRFMYFDDAQ